MQDLNADEEEAILQREFGYDEEEAKPINSNDRATNDETVPTKVVAKPKQPITSTKSTKQSNLADWGVCSSAASKGLVGQKRKMEKEGED